MDQLSDLDVDFGEFTTDLGDSIGVLIGKPLELSLRAMGSSTKSSKVAAAKDRTDRKSVV